MRNFERKIGKIHERILHASYIVLQCPKTSHKSRELSIVARLRSRLQNLFKSLVANRFLCNFDSASLISSLECNIKENLRMKSKSPIKYLRRLNWKFTNCIVSKKNSQQNFHFNSKTAIKFNYDHRRLILGKKHQIRLIQTICKTAQI